MLYTVVPMEDVLDDDPRPVMMDVPRGDAVIRITVTNEGRAEVQQLISTNPEHYLQRQYMPGSTLSLSPADYTAWQETMRSQYAGHNDTAHTWGEQT